MKRIMAVLIAVLVLTGCSSGLPDAELSDNPYSRGNINFYSESPFFGTGKSQDLDVALKYLYESEEMAARYGNNFQITYEQIVCVKSEGKTYFLSNIFSGDAIYEIKLGDATYKLTLSKEPLGKWKVDSCECII